MSIRGKTLKLIISYLIIINIPLINQLKSNDLYPASPSSSYGSDYFTRENLNTKKNKRLLNFDEINFDKKSKKKK